MGDSGSSASSRTATTSKSKTIPLLRYLRVHLRDIPRKDEVLAPKSSLPVSLCLCSSIPSQVRAGTASRLRARSGGPAGAPRTWTTVEASTSGPPGLLVRKIAELHIWRLKTTHQRISCYPTSTPATLAHRSCTKYTQKIHKWAHPLALPYPWLFMFDGQEIRRIPPQSIMQRNRRRVFIIIIKRHFPP